MNLKLKLAAVALLPLSLMACNGDSNADTQKERAAQLAEFNVRAIELPKALFDHRAPSGVYEITISTSEGKKDCIANVILTTHGYKNVILTNCH